MISIYDGIVSFFVAGMVIGHIILPSVLKGDKTPWKRKMVFNFFNPILLMVPRAAFFAIITVSAGLVIFVSFFASLPFTIAYASISISCLATSTICRKKLEAVFPQEIAASLAKFDNWKR